MKNSVKIKNETLTLEAIQNDSRKAAAELSSLLTQRATAEQELADTKVISAKEKEIIAEERNKLQERTLDIANQEADHEASKKEKQKEIDALDGKIRDGNKLLERINGFIFDANEEYDKKQGDLRDINAEIAGKDKLAEGILALQNDYAEHEKKRDGIRSENALSLADAAAGVEKARTEQKDAETKRDQALADAADAETRKQKALDETQRIEADSEIYKARIQVNYAEAFPDLTAKF